jgi:enhancer of polycomb-like protein
LQDFAAINRSVPQMPTGMEKDEEAEHHLQRALSAFQVFGVQSTSTNEYAIPTPMVETDEKLYNRIYNNDCVKFKQYIRIQRKCFFSFFCFASFSNTFL